MSFRLHDALAYHARCAPDRLAVDGDTGRWTYDRLWSDARLVASALQSRGLGRGGRIAILSKNRGEILALLFGAALAGSVAVPLNHRLSVPELDWIMRDSEAALVFYEAEFSDRLGAWPAVEIGHAVDPAHWPATPPALPRDTGDYLQIYTSGTTGHPKGVVLTESNAMAQQAAISASLSARLAPGDAWYQCLPLFHVGGIFTSLHGLFNGATLILRRDFSPRDALTILSDPAPRHAVMVPTMIQACVALPAEKGEAFSGLKTLLFGASPISADLLRRAALRFGCPFAQVYGMTETHSVITVMNPEDYTLALRGERPELLAAAGRPVAGTDLLIVGPDGREVAPGATGEIIVRSGHVMSGYWRRPADTAETLRGGFLHTGDAGRLDADGFLYIVDRIKDIIVSGGENISSLDVENALAAHPMVGEVAVVGVPHPHWGEAVHAVVVPRTGTAPTVAELLDFCRGRLAGFKMPRGIEFVTALPRNGAGKILKRKLREPHWRDQARHVG